MDKSNKPKKYYDLTKDQRIEIQNQFMLESKRSWMNLTIDPNFENYTWKKSDKFGWILFNANLLPLKNNTAGLSL